MPTRPEPLPSITFRLMMCAPGATPRVSSWAFTPLRGDDAGHVRAVPELVRGVGAGEVQAGHDAVAQLRHVGHAGIDHRHADALAGQRPRAAQLAAVQQGGADRLVGHGHHGPHHGVAGQLVNVAVLRQSRPARRPARPPPHRRSAAATRAARAARPARPPVAWLPDRITDVAEASPASNLSRQVLRQPRPPALGGGVACGQHGQARRSARIRLRGWGTQAERALP